MSCLAVAGRGSSKTKRAFSLPSLSWVIHDQIISGDGEGGSTWQSIDREREKVGKKKLRGLLDPGHVPVFIYLSNCLPSIVVVGVSERRGPRRKRRWWMKKGLLLQHIYLCVHV